MRLEPVGYMKASDLRLLRLGSKLFDRVDLRPDKGLYSFEALSLNKIC